MGTEATQRVPSKQMQGLQLLLFAAILVMTIVDLIDAWRGHPMPVHRWLIRGGLISAFGAPLVIRPLRNPLLAAAIVLLVVAVITWRNGS